MSTTSAARRPVLEAASSSDESDDDDDQSDVEQAPLIKSIDDLPSDDSVSLDDDDDNSDDDDGPPVSAFNDDRNYNNGISLSEKMERHKEAGVFTLQQKRDRRSAALVKAKEQLKQNVDKEKRKKSKNAPTEVSSKRKDHFLRGAPQLNSAGIGVEIGAHRYKSRDPRMSSMSGHLQEDHFDHHYGFLQDMRTDEITAVQRRLKARKVDGKKGQKLRQKLGLTALNAPSVEDDQEHLLSLKQQQAQYARNQVDRAAKQAVKRKIRDEVETGQRGVYFVKRAEQKKMELEARFDELDKLGTLDKVMARKLKKNKSKDSSFMR
jgi:ribosomal RNA-processing protein 36